MTNDDNMPTLGLLDLPAELRNKIYELVFNDIDEEVLCPFVWQLDQCKNTYSLTQTCDQIRRETLSMYYAGKKLLFAMRQGNVRHYERWLQRRPDAAITSIRRIQLEDYQHSKNRCPAQHPYFCRSAIIINLVKPSPVSWRRDSQCMHCLLHDSAVDRVNAVVRARKGERGTVMTREKLEEIFEAAAWEA
ncbi:hypothetical protein LTR09_007528 [Extremus antarcticus]|uniref:F-box domain-containing protein n=1 Tax=Extremus antarcticus TaxID=702011 RepID=A0AAJ0DBY4_9PEZI|nr:hypothetical protein LTR09_007528 [Extremus antarcticus]